MRSLRPLRVFGACLLASVGVAGVACLSSNGAPPAPSSDAGGSDDSNATATATDSSAPLDAGTAADADAGTPNDAGADSADSSDSAVVDAADASDGAPPAPTPLVTGLDNPEGLTVYGGNLFWVDYASGTLSTCPVAGCTTPTVLITGLTNPITITNDGTSLFWAANTGQPQGSILSASITQCLMGPTACAASMQTIGSNFSAPGDVAVDNANVYFTSINSLEGGVTNGLYACPKSGCPADGGVTAVLVTGISDDPGMSAVQGTNLYYSDYTTGAFVCTLPACATPTAIAGPGFGVKGIALDTTSFYWSDQSAGVIYSCPIAGCGDASAPVVVGRGFGYPNAIALDTSYVYISVGSQDATELTKGIYRLPK